MHPEQKGRYPALAGRLYEADGTWRDFVSVFVDGEDTRYLDRAVALDAKTEV